MNTYRGMQKTVDCWDIKSFEDFVSDMIRNLKVSAPEITKTYFSSHKEVSQMILFHEIQPCKINFLMTDSVIEK